MAVLGLPADFLFYQKRGSEKPRPKAPSLGQLLFVLTTNKTTHSGEIAPGNLPSIQTSFVA
jgi:hypothetical protein